VITTPALTMRATTIGISSDEDGTDKYYYHDEDGNYNCYSYDGHGNANDYYSDADDSDSDSSGEDDSSGGNDDNCVVMALYEVFNEMVWAGMIPRMNRSQNPGPTSMMDDLADQFGSTALNDGYWS
jgi:hypothetical protein